MNASGIPEVSEDFAEATGQLAEQLEGCVRTLCAVVDKHTDEISTLPPNGGPISTRGHGIWRARAFQLRGLQAYFQALSHSDFAAASAVKMDRYGDGV